VSERGEFPDKGELGGHKFSGKDVFPKTLHKQRAQKNAYYSTIHTKVWNALKMVRVAPFFPLFNGRVH